MCLRKAGCSIHAVRHLICSVRSLPGRTDRVKVNFQVRAWSAFEFVCNPTTSRAKHVIGESAFKGIALQIEQFPLTPLATLILARRLLLLFD